MSGVCSCKSGPCLYFGTVKILGQFWFSDFIKDPKLTDEWCSLMAKIAPESKNDIPKIKRSFAKYFEIKEAMDKVKN